MSAIIESPPLVAPGPAALERRGSFGWLPKRWTLHSVRGTLVWLVVVCVLPGWLGMGLLITNIYRSERERVIQNTVLTAGAMAQSVDAELSSMRTALEVLATSPEIAAANFSTLYTRAQDLLRSGTLPGSNIVLTDRSGQQIFNTLKSFGQALPPHANSDIVHKVLETGRPVTTDVHWGPVAKEFGIAVLVPVFVDGSVMYVLTSGVFQHSLRQLLERQSFPANWLVSIFDPKGVIATRSHEPEKFSGQYGSSRLLDAMRGRNNGFVKSKTLEGVSVYSAFSRSEHSNWSVAIGIPQASSMPTSIKSSAGAAVGRSCSWFLDSGLRRTIPSGYCVPSGPSSLD